MTFQKQLLVSAGRLLSVPTVFTSKLFFFSVCTTDVLTDQDRLFDIFLPVNQWLFVKCLDI